MSTAAQRRRAEKKASRSPRPDHDPLLVTVRCGSCDGEQRNRKGGDRPASCVRCPSEYGTYVPLAPVRPTG